jgi:hypothetical protein
MDAKPSLAVIAFPSSAWERDNKSLMAKKQAEQTFEAALKRLEEVLGSLEHGDLALEDSLPAEVGRGGKAGGVVAQGRRRQIFHPALPRGGRRRELRRFTTKTQRSKRATK